MRRILQGPEGNFRDLVSESVSHSASETDRERERMVLKIIKHYDMFYPCTYFFVKQKKSESETILHRKLDQTKRYPKSTQL